MNLFAVSRRKSKRMRPTHAPFQPTRWTLIAEANGPDKAAARAALEKLCVLYWYPLYACVRRKGLGPEDADDAVQGFTRNCVRSSRRFVRQ